MRYLLVDAHSVIFRCPTLQALHERFPEAAREQLIQHLEGYQDATGIRVVVIFDGKGSRTTEEKRPGSVQIFYSGGRGDADQVIGRLVAKYAQTYELTVATNDHLVQQTCTTFGGLAINVDMLLADLDRTRADLARQLKKIRRNR